ncbi:MAG: hypothetical protein ILP02_04940 [Clostridia bacterium]|nr:hypothetical protein [Clostridia bacterium]
MLEKEYKILGVSENATDEELDRAYRDRKAVLEEDRFLDGEAGNKAAQELTALNAAYEEVRSFRAQSARVDETGSFKSVDEAIKEGDYKKAQEILDGFDSRSAEWHYMQSVVFYKKNWVNESKKQLEIAKEMDPDNEKYKRAYDRMIEKLNQPQAGGGDWNKSGSTARGGNTYQGGYNDGAQMGGDGCLEWCCQMLACNMCLNCLCNCR